jgi:hypothetical protein
MASWNQLLADIQRAGSTYDIVRRNCLAQLHQITGRNVIIYYSGWLQKPALRGVSAIRWDINDADKEALMATIHGLDRKLGLDLFLHTPGGEIAATESIIDYLRAMFGDIRAIIPQLAMSAGTMVACSCNEIVMGKQSSLGPIDPQLNGLPAHGIIEEFRRAQREIKLHPERVPVWQPIIAKYQPTLIGECEKAIKWSQEMVFERLKTCMFKGQVDAARRAKRVIKELGDHALTKSHSRHISIDRAKQIGLKILDMESDQKLQDAVLSVHHSSVITLAETAACKIIENHMGVGQMQSVQVQQKT